MAINIESIQIQKLGPLSSQQLDLGLLNLIYGHNESGKTYLVEFLLHSIFRHAKTWNLRDINPEGTVYLQGLEKQVTTFSPSSSRKIEDYWNENDKGLPINMARLLVVKGGELALSANSPGGVNREILKNALTSRALLDQLRDSIQPTVRKAQIIDQKISGKNQGQINDLNVLQDKLQDIEKLLKLIEDRYSRGPARQIEDQIGLFQMQLDQQLKAKKYRAYLLSNKRKDLRSQRDNISGDKFQSLRDQVRDHKKLRSELENLSERISSVKVDVDNYHWLESAVKIWEEKELENKRLPEKMLVLTGGSLLITGLIVTTLQNIFNWPYLFWTGISTAAIGGLLLAYFGIQLLRGTKNPADASERDTVRATYKEIFGQPLKGITTLRAELNKAQVNFLKANSMQEELGKLEVQIGADRQKIIEIFFELLEKIVEEQDWKKNLKTIKDQSSALDAEISKIALELARFNLDDDDYIAEPQDIIYDPQVQADTEDQLASLEDELASHQSELDTLKARATEWTRDDISTPWINVLHHLRTIRTDLSQSTIDLTAEIVAKIGLSEILRKIEEEEDQKILENLNTDEVSSLLNKLTGKYQGLNLIDDQIYARDPYQEYPLRDLSTGAREQIQLALRLGIASHVSGGEPLFIILDDAFQHSDWNRRTSLVQETVDLASQGWQVIYLSMDDHIRDLFQKIAKPVLKKKFKYFELD